MAADSDMNTHRAGWWLPPPRARFDAPGSPERTARFRFFGAMVVRAWVFFVAGFGGLMWSDPHMNTGQQFFSTLMFAGGTGLVVVLGMALAWCSS